MVLLHKIENGCGQKEMPPGKAYKSNKVFVFYNPIVQCILVFDVYQVRVGVVILHRNGNGMEENCCFCLHKSILK